MTEFKLSVNGKSHKVDADSATPLIYVLRDNLTLNGPRTGCGSEQCGACRVLVDGKPEFSCTYRLRDAAGKTITTVEGLGTIEHLHPIQEAFLEFNAAQCGYCASGIIISAADLLARNPNPSREDIQEALTPNLCRCGAHNRVIKAVSRAAELIALAGNST